jgi:hypothetical protein
LPWRVIPGDHDFETGDLSIYNAAFPEACRPEMEVIAGHRCIFLDVVSAGDGGPDFRLSMHDRNRLAHELTRAEAAGQTPLVFMHAYPGDLAADGEEVARTLADARVPFVATGHTHYNEILNDGYVIYGATRSTGEIEEGDGMPGYSVVCVHDTIPSWRFRTIGSQWPLVQIVSPCDQRLVTRPADPRQVPRPGSVPVSVRVLGEATTPPLLSASGSAPSAMTRQSPGLWSGQITVEQPGLHRIVAECGEASDAIDVLVRDADDIPKRARPVALGHACHAIGAWPAAGIEGTQLGPNRNGRRW